MEAALSQPIQLDFLSQAPLPMVAPTTRKIRAVKSKSVVLENVKIDPQIPFDHLDQRLTHELLHSINCPKTSLITLKGQTGKGKTTYLNALCDKLIQNGQYELDKMFFQNGKGILIHYSQFDHNKDWANMMKEMIYQYDILIIDDFFDILPSSDLQSDFCYILDYYQSYKKKVILGIDEQDWPKNGPIDRLQRRIQHSKSIHISNDKKTNKPITEYIKKYCYHFQCASSDLIGLKNDKTMSRHRYILSTILTTQLSFSILKVSKYLGLHHSTLIYGIRKIQEECQHNHSLKKSMELFITQ